MIAQYLANAREFSHAKGAGADGRVVALDEFLCLGDGSAVAVDALRFANTVRANARRWR